MHGGHGSGMHGGGGGDDGGGFGVRRPLRFLAYRLSLDDRQTAEVARILDELKTERAQVSVDERRTVSAFADVLEAETLDAAKLDEAAAARVRSSERLKNAAVTALKGIHAVLDPEQRKQFAFLIRTGAVQL
ncbi:Spy/CpxP family protein refolding chaperone [Anaeromyxobacter diazotrophicus]|nr:Spy/CpxP family protein refolding chaperone [Anaeromyxobacter diazotrophicus]